MQGSRIRRGIIATAAAVMVCGAITQTASAVDVSITPSTSLLNFINVSELPSNGGAYVYGQPYSLERLQANFAGNDLKIGPMMIDDPSAFWFQGAGGAPGAAGNKSIDASAYVENDALAGQTVTFSGVVTSNSLAAGYTATAFIKAFALNYSSNTGVSIPLAPGPFSITFAAPAGTHVQYGYETIGPNVWITDGATKGFVTVAAVPEPATLGAVVASAGALLARRRRAV